MINVSDSVKEKPRQPAGNGKIILAQDKGSNYCYIKRIYDEDGDTYLEVDFVQFLKGDEAVEIAKREDEAPYDINENGDTIYFVYNDYYISNQNPKLRTFKLSPDVKIDLLNFGVNEKIKDNDLASLKKKELEFSPMIITSESGIVNDIVEQYIP